METYAPSCTALEWKEIMMMMMTAITNKLPTYLNSQQLKNLGLRFVSNHAENLEKYKRIFNIKFFLVNNLSAHCKNHSPRDK